MASLLAGIRQLVLTLDGSGSSSSGRRWSSMLVANPKTCLASTNGVRTPKFLSMQMLVRRFRLFANAAQRRVLLSAQSFAFHSQQRSSILRWRAKSRIDDGLSNVRRSRKSFSGWFNGDRIVGTLIALNCGVFILWQTADKGFMADNFTVSLYNLQEGRIWTLVTSCFSQSDSLHLLFNVLGIYFFCGNVLAVLGPQRFLTFYLSGGIVSAAAHVGYENYVLRRRPRNFQDGFGPRYSYLIPKEHAAMGASGAVSAVIATYACMFPKHTFLVYGIIPMSAATVAIGSGIYESYSLYASRAQNVSHVSHLSGLSYGLLYYLMRVR